MLISVFAEKSISTAHKGAEGTRAALLLSLRVHDEGPKKRDMRKEPEKELEDFAELLPPGPL